MDTTAWLLLAVFIIGFAALISFFVTKTKDFGRFATSTFLLLLAVVVSALLYATGKLNGQVLANRTCNAALLAIVIGRRVLRRGNL